MTYLDPAGIAAALDFVAGEWPKEPMTPAVTEAWNDILCQLRPGELKAALELDPSEKRPDPYEVFEAILSHRPDSRYTPDGPTPDGKPLAHHERVLAEARARLRRAS
jgi:hypothetical protein